VFAQALDLFTAAPEHESVATFQANDLTARTCGLDQPAVDLVLPDAGLAFALADEHALGVTAHTVEHRLGHELIVEHDVGILQYLQRAQREQIRIAGTRADQEHRTGIGAGIASAASIDAAHEIGLGARIAAGQHRGTDRPVDDLLPEHPRRQRKLRFGDALAIAAHQRREIADARGHDCFDALAQPSRQHRRMTVGADRHHDIAAIDDGRKHETRQIGTVDHVDRNAGIAGARGNFFVACIAEGAHHRDRAGEVRSQGIMKIDLEPARSDGRLYDLVGDIGVAGIPAHRRTRGQEQPQLIDGVLARTHERHRAAGDIHKNREKPHRQPSCSHSL
jgi:hypothetical protein